MIWNEVVMDQLIYDLAGVLARVSSGQIVSRKCYHMSQLGSWLYKQPKHVIEYLLYLFFS
jgi:hypothetical protein